jgi:rRNA maturation endonuclease Nob1
MENKLKCESCGKIFNDDDKFCGNCGSGRPEIKPEKVEPIKPNVANSGHPDEKNISKEVTPSKPEVKATESREESEGTEDAKVTLSPLKIFWESPKRNLWLGVGCLGISIILFLIIAVTVIIVLATQNS